MSEFEQQMLDQCFARLRELDDERDQVMKVMKALGYKKPRRSKRRQATAMPELDSHRSTRLQVVTQKPLTKDEARQIVEGEIGVAGQT